MGKSERAGLRLLLNQARRGRGKNTIPQSIGHASKVLLSSKERSTVLESRYYEVAFQNTKADHGTAACPPTRYDKLCYVSSKIPPSVALHRDRPIAWAGNRIKIRASTEQVSPLFVEEGLPPLSKDRSLVGDKQSLISQHFSKIMF